MAAVANRTRLGLREIRSLNVSSEVWDTSVPGFGARRQLGELVSYIVMYRNKEGRQRRYTIGKHGKWTPDTARAEARRILASVADGQDPAAVKSSDRQAQTIAQLCESYLEDAEAGTILTRRGATKKSSTLAIDRLRVDRHIKPLLGHRIIGSVTREDVDAFMHAVAQGKTVPAEAERGKSRTTGGKGTASRTIGLLGAVFAYAMRRNLRPDNPVRGVVRFADGRRERRLSDQEYGQLGIALQTAEGQFWPPALAGMRFLALTGWRRGEMLNLSWSEIDLDRRTVVLADSKTGRSMRPLSKSVCSLLGALPRTGTLVFPAMRGDSRMSSFGNLFTRLVERSGLPPAITPHVLRHSFASVAADLGLSESTIATLIGHNGQTITSRYVHSADDVLLAAADRVAGRISELLG